MTEVTLGSANLPQTQAWTGESCIAVSPTSKRLGGLLFALLQLLLPLAAAWQPKGQWLHAAPVPAGQGGASQIPNPGTCWGWSCDIHRVSAGHVQCPAGCV